MSVPFAPKTTLERLVHAGDYEGVLALLRPLGEIERRRHASEATRMEELLREHRWKDASAPGVRWDSHPSKEQERAAEAALALCATPKAIANSWIDDAHFVELAREFRVSYLPEVAQEMLVRSPVMIRVVQRLIGEGLIARPESDEYALGLITLPEYPPRGMSLEQCFEADPGLKRSLLRMFDVEGNSETSLTSSDKYRKRNESWSERLQRMCAEGAFEREELLDRTLSALERDWPQYRSGWFSRFHAELKPTPAELKARADRYLHLLGSRIPPTVSLALEAVSRMATVGSLDVARTIPALRPVLARGNKQQVEAAIRLLEKCVVADPTSRDEAMLAACAGLVTESPPLQAKLLQFIGNKPSAAVVEALSRHQAGVSASNRAAYEAIVGVDAVEHTPVLANQDRPRGDGPTNPLSDARRLTGVRDVDELVELVAFSLENPADFEAFERAATLVAAISRPDEVIGRFGSVLKRAGKVKAPLPCELARLLVFVFRGQRWEASKEPEPGLRLVQLRIDSLIELAARRTGGVALATPTHRGGYIAPAELVSRLRQHRELGVETSDFERQLALLRLGPAAPGDLELARELPDNPMARALRYALGDGLQGGLADTDFCAAARIRHPRSDDPLALQRLGDLGPDGPAVARYRWSTKHHRGSGYEHYSIWVDSTDGRNYDDRFLAVSRHLEAKSERYSYSRLLCGRDAGVIGYFGILFPSDYEAYFAEGVRTIGNNLDWWEACWHERTFLEPMLDPAVELGEMALLVLACGLSGKEPGQAALAVDCLVQAWRDGRLDISRFADVHARLAFAGMARLARVRKNLDAALRIEPGLVELAVAVAEHIILATPEHPPKDFAKFLELLHEILVASSTKLHEPIADHLVTLKLGGAAVSLRKRLLSMAMPDTRPRRQRT